MRIILRLLIFLIAYPLKADVMNLNDLMPVSLEDATPIEEKSFDSQTSLGFTEDGHADQVIFRQNFRYGLNKAVQLETYGDVYSGGDEQGSGQIWAGPLWDFLKEDDHFPSMAISPMLIIPTGKERDLVSYDSKIILTKTLIGSFDTPTLQFHFNLNWTHHPQPSEAERLNYYTSALGLSYLYSDHQVLVINFLREEEVEKEKEMNLIEMGVHYEVTKSFFIGVSGSTGLGDESPSFRSILSFEKQFQ